MKTWMQISEQKTPQPNNATISQIYNPLTGNYIKMDMISGRILDIKTNGRRFKGIKQELPIVRMNGFSVPKSIARKAERAVIKVINERLNKA